MNISAAAFPTDKISQPPSAVAINNLVKFLKDRREDVREILTDVTSHSAAEAEILASIKALEGAILEIEMRQPRSVSQMAVFMPSNIILYSYVLYLVIPSLFVQKIEFRPSSYVAEQTAKLHALLAPVHKLPLLIRSVSQRTFAEESVRPANIVVFTGTYANAERIKLQLRKDQLYIFFGQGINPFIIGEHANLDKAVNDLVRIRMFNTGQDCMGPDAIFVHCSVADELISRLRDHLQRLIFGSRKDPKADYSRIYYPSTLDAVSKFFIANAHFICAGGVIDYSLQKIEPTILYSTLERRPEIKEFFGPVFNVITYANDDSLKCELGKSFYRDRAMGATVYGNTSLANFLRSHHSVSVDATLFDIEDGNSPFGGYGPMANYAYYQGQLKIRPLLISQVVSDLL